MDSGYPSLRPPAPAVPAAPAPTPATPPVDDPFGRRSHTESPVRDLRKRIGSALAAVVALIAKFFSSIKGVLLLLPKLKLLTTAGTAFVSIAAYSLFWGWPFAAGFVVLLFVHEMGHVIQLRREGIKASAPMFIPFLVPLSSPSRSARTRSQRRAWVSPDQSSAASVQRPSPWWGR